jgi:hypothetical protein
MRQVTKSAKTLCSQEIYYRFERCHMYNLRREEYGDQLFQVAGMIETYTYVLSLTRLYCASTSSTSTEMEVCRCECTILSQICRRKYQGTEMLTFLSRTTAENPQFVNHIRRYACAYGLL